MIDLTSRYPGSAGYDWRSLAGVTHACIHHMGTLGFVANNVNPLAQIDSINAYHRDHHGWPGIGYHIVVTDREWYLVTPLERISWHVAFNNYYSVGILILGDYTTGGRPSPAHIKQLRAALAWVTLKTRRLMTILGHKEFPQNPTTCPGPLWANWKSEVTRRDPRPAPALDVESIDFAEVDFYAKWAIARHANNEDPRNFMAFTEHLRGVGKDFRKPYFYGWPSTIITRNATILVPEVDFYAKWALLRAAAKEDPRDLAAFQAHLAAIGKNSTQANLYGWPLI